MDRRRFSLLLVGLAGSQMAGLVVVAASRQNGWLKVLGVGGALFASLWWVSVLVIGRSTTGFGGVEHDPRIIFFSLPELSAGLTGVPTLLIATLAIVGRRSDRAGRSSPT